MTRDDPQPRADRPARLRATKTAPKTAPTDATPPSLLNELESVYRSITDGVFIFDSEGRLIRINDAGRKLLRLASEDESYLTMPALTRIERSNLRDPGGAPMLEREWIITRLLGGEIITPEHAVDVLMSRADGADALIAFTGAPLRDGAGAITGAVAVGRDVTGRRLREAELHQSNLQLTATTQALTQQAGALEQRNQRMDQFLGMANHEMKSPLTALSANLQLASRRLRRLARVGGQSAHAAGQIEGQTEGLLDAAHISHEAESVLEMLARAQSAARRMTRLVNELLDVSRIQAGRLETRPEPCDLLALTRTAITEQLHAQPGRADQASRDITLETTCEQAPIIADPDRISEVIDNYLSNAIKYSPPTTPITVALACEEAAEPGAAGMARLSVRDAGPGISPEAQARIWNVFERLDSDSAQPTEGVNLGLGLHICKTIIALHGGEVGVESAPGAGATFWFTLPLPPANCSPALPRAAPSRARTSTGPAAR